MEDTRWTRWLGYGLLASMLGLASCAPPSIGVEDLPTAEATLAEIGVRLSQTHSADALTKIATRGEFVLPNLTRAERDALGRNWLRFRVDRPTIVHVASPRESVPFWVADQGFVPTGLTLKVRESKQPWVVSRKIVPAGAVGLGVNALDQTSEAHYCVFLRAVDGSPIAPALLDDGGHWRLTQASEGSSLASGVSLTCVKLPAELRSALLVQPSHDRRHATLLARGRVWKTHVVSGRKPDQVTIAFGLDASRELVWSWRTSPAAARSLVRMRRVGSTEERIIAGDLERVETPDVLNDPVVFRHVVRVSSLEPGTTYTYSVGDGTKEGTSTDATIRTAPVPGGDFRLMYLGDPQCGLEGWGKLLADAYARQPDVGAILIAGDLVDRGNERTNWDHFFLRAAGVFERVPMMPCAGNHEYLDRGPRAYRTFFELPDNGPGPADRDLVYSFEYADALIAVLDSTRAVFDPEEALRQAEWLDQVLANTDRTWKIVMFHHPVYASHTWREYPGLRDAWVPVFDRHRVDLVLQGHDHSYMRTYPLREHRRVGASGSGTVYAVAVSGDKYCEQDLRDYGAVGYTNLSTYQIIDVRARENRLTYRAFDRDGREFDQFVIDKPRRRSDVASGAGP
jgi:hypothetical protein